MKHFCHYLILVGIIFLSNKFEVTSSEYCPEKCKCDFYLNQNRANCSDWNLINAAIDIPKNVEIFDLSRNSITTLDNKCFEGLQHITNLAISGNSIHTIYLDAFNHLNKLRSLDLSNNRLEHFDNRILENNKKLYELNLSGNKFLSLLNDPLICSESLVILLLKNSQITHIYTKLFDLLPKLQKLDLSNNLMITINVSPFNKLRKLNWLNLEGNPWICDKNIANVVTLLRHRQVHVEIKETCKMKIDKDQPKMFERIILQPKSEIQKTTIPTTTERLRTKVEMVWKSLDLLNDNCLDDDPVKICTLYSDLIKSHEKLLEKHQNITMSSKNDAINQHRYFQVIGDVEVAFLIGMSLGAAMVFILVACTLCTAKCYKSIENRKKNESNDCVATDDFQYIVPSPQILPQRTPRRNRRHGAVDRQISCPNYNRPYSTPARNQNDFATFLTRLFERPSHHRYYRTINQNTANMIRRLSRSNLFNNRFSRHLSEENNRNNNYSNENNNQNIQNEGQRLMSSQPQRSASSDELNELEINNLEETHKRPETPPPLYKDVAIVKY